MATVPSEEKTAMDSEEARGVCCSMCSDNGDTSTAEHYCVDCEIYLCIKCLKWHNKIPATKAHQVNDVEYSDQAVKTQPKEQTEKVSRQKLRCHVHHGEVIDSYCTNHEELCCGICALIKHRACNVEEIVVMAKDFKSNPKAKQCEHALSNILKDMNQEIDIRMNNLLSIEQDKIDMLESVDKYEEEVQAMVTKLADTSRKQIRDKSEVHKQVLNTDVEVLKAAVLSTSKSIDKMVLAEDTQLFIDVETGKLLLKENAHLLETMSSDWNKREVKYRIDERINKHFDGRESFGNIVNRAVIRTYEATLYKIVDKAITKRMFGICILESGDLFLTDTDGKCLKRCSFELKFKGRIDTSDYPVSVCRVSANEVAVRSLGGQVQIISAHESMKVESSFEVEGGGCGLTFDVTNEEFFVCEKTKVSVYSKSGEKLRAFDKTSNGEQLFSDCRQIYIDTETKYIHVTDSKNCLITLYRSGNLKSTFTSLGIKSAWAFCKLPGDIYLVSDKISEYIVQVDRLGKKIGRLNIPPSFTFVYDHVHNRLVAGGESSLRAYTLSARE